MPAIVRHFVPEDADSVQRLVLGIQREEFGVAVTLEEQPDLRDAPTYYQKDHGAFWVAVDGSDGFVEMPQEAFPDHFPRMRLDTRFYRYDLGPARVTR